MPHRLHTLGSKYAACALVWVEPVRKIRKICRSWMQGARSGPRYIGVILRLERNSRDSHGVHAQSFKAQTALPKL